MQSTKGGTHQLPTTRAARQLAVHQGIIEIKSGQRRISSVLFTGDGKQVLSGDDERVIRQWRPEDGKEVCEPIRAKGGIYAITLSLNGKMARMWGRWGERSLSKTNYVFAVWRPGR